MLNGVSCGRRVQVDASRPRPAVHQRGAGPLDLHQGGKVSQVDLAPALHGCFCTDQHSLMFPTYALWVCLHPPMGHSALQAS